MSDVCVPLLGPTLEENEVHVWSARLDLPRGPIERLERLLDSEETAKASRFHFDQDRNVFTAARGILRTLLACYLGERPESIRFVYGPYGKPALAPGGPGACLRFNLSHSGALGLFAFAWLREVGIDVERVRAQPDFDDIAERFFSREEVSALRRLPRRLQNRAFFTCWTRKEAYIKARGGGFSIPLNEFSVSLAPGEPAEILRSALEAGETTPWSLRDLSIGSHYAAALAVEGRGWRLRRWSWSRRGSGGRLASARSFLDLP